MLRIRKQHVEGDEQRKHLRVPHAESVIVTITACKADPSLVGERAPCSGRDASVNGLQLALAAPIPEGTELGLEVAFAGARDSYRLVGHVKWSRWEMERSTHLLGLFIEDRKRTDFPKWRDAVLDKARFMDL